MLDRLFWLHTRITHDQCIRVVLLRNNYEIHIDKTDVLKSDDNKITVFHANGGIVVINPEHITMMCTMSKGSVLL